MSYTGSRPLNILLSLAGGMVLTLACLAPTTSVQAEEGVIEEIVVTATKRGETALMDTPITINVVTGDDLRLREIRGPEDLRTAVSGLYIDEGSSTPRVAIRGVGFDNFNVQAENGVTTYVDGVVIQRTHAVLAGFLDLAQIEVLKGPQGSAFGRNATGGAINLITAKPEQGTSGEVSAGFGSFNRSEVSGVLNFGGDQFAVRLSGSYENDDGYITNLATGNDELNGKEQTLGRIALSWVPTDRFSLDYSLSLSSYEFVAPGQDHSTAGSAAAAAGFGTFVLGLTPLVTPPTGTVDDRYVVVNSIDPYTDREMDLHALTLDFDLGWATLKSITGYIDFGSTWTSDVGLPSGFAEGLVRVRYSRTYSEQFSQELLLSGSTERFNWVTGLYYLEEEAYDDGEFDLNIAAPALPIGTIFKNLSGQDLTSYAVFADGQLMLTDRSRLNAGIRWTDDTKEATGTQRTIVTPFFTVPGASIEHLEVSDDSITWQVGLEYDLSDDIFTYARIAEGYKAGGINNSASSYYLPEELISFEVGAKGELANSFTFSLAGFYSNYENIQLFINRPENPGVPDITNAGEATIAGFDLDVDWRPADSFSFDAQITWLTEAQYEDFVAFDGVRGVVTDFSGGDLNRSPEFTGVFGANLYGSLTDRVELSARIELYVTSSIAYSFLHEYRPEGALTQDGYQLVNLFVSATIDENWELRAYGKNVGDEFYITTAVEGVPGFQYAIHGRPDEYGLELRYKF